MRHVVMRALHVCVCSIAFIIAAHAQVSAPQPANTATNNQATAAPLDDVHRQLQEQHEEIERLRDALQTQSQLLQQLLTRNADARAQPGSVESATYRTDMIATTDTLSCTQGATTRASVQTTPASAPKPTEITTGLLSSLSFSGDLRLRFESQFGQ